MHVAHQAIEAHHFSKDLVIEVAIVACEPICGSYTALLMLKSRLCAPIRPVVVTLPGLLGEMSDEHDRPPSAHCLYSYLISEPAQQRDFSMHMGQCPADPPPLVHPSRKRIGGGVLVPAVFHVARRQQGHVAAV
jgi:hypothetical protein